MAINLLSDVDVYALSIVKEGANRKQFFLRKSSSGDDPGAAELCDLPPVHHRLIKADDWSAVYCVVAEPGHREGPGLGADQEHDDEWATEDEIRKAAWRFAENRGIVNRMHESLEEYGTVVENAVALGDFSVDGETIKKGSWYVAIKPNAEGKAAIEKGEFRGVSIQGSAVRTLVEKDGDNRLKLATLDLKDQGTVKRMLAKIGEAVGLSKDDLQVIEQPVEKSARTFNQTLAAREVDEELPDYFDALRSVIWRALYPYSEDEEVGDPRADIETSCDQFRDAVLALYDRTPVDKREGLAKQIATVATTGDSTEDSDTMNQEERERIEKAEQAGSDALAAVKKLADDLKPVIEKAAEAVKPTVEDVAKAQVELTESMAKVQKLVEGLAEGDTTQDGGADTDEVKKGTGDQLATALLG